MGLVGLCLVRIQIYVGYQKVGSGISLDESGSIGLSLGSSSLLQIRLDFEWTKTRPDPTWMGQVIYLSLSGCVACSVCYLRTGKKVVCLKQQCYCTVSLRNIDSKPISSGKKSKVSNPVHEADQVMNESLSLMTQEPLEPLPLLSCLLCPHPPSSQKNLPSQEDGHQDNNVTVAMRIGLPNCPNEPTKSNELKEDQMLTY